MPSKAIPWLKVLVHGLCLLPFMKLVMMYRAGTLVALADPVQFLTHFTGDWALWILLLDLAITPVRRLSPKLAWLIRLRRMVGLYSFFYATLHLLVYVFLFSGYDVPSAMDGLKAGHWGEPFHQLALVWPSMWDDVLKRRFIQVGLLAWVLLLALAVTSPQRVLRWMGGKRWQKLHRMVYVAAFAAVVHFWWLVKAGVREPWKVTAVLAVLLLARLLWWARQRRKKAAPVFRTA
ncbi:MAG: ferric reductase-like transmembrane domain-containing protein [Acidobacteriaceae bacterium]|nr:ferric reductase-like transmembrane domain-containing protein [Acidobacteriaceae bacterium]